MIRANESETEIPSDVELTERGDHSDEDDSEYNLPFTD